LIFGQVLLATPLPEYDREKEGLLMCFIVSHSNC